MKRNNMIKLISISALYLLATACSTNPVTGKSNFVMMSEQQEVQLGNKYHKQVMTQYSLYDNPKLAKYLNDIGQKMAEKSHRPDLNFRFTLLDSPQVNAFAVPGGYVYITRGIMAYMQDEAQLAGVVGHEIGHVTARHSVRQHAQSQLAGLMGAAVAIGTGSREAAQLSNMLGGAVVKGYGRSHELESDRLGAEYLAKTGYDSKKMIEVVGILKDQEMANKEKALAEGRQPASYHGLFASHPRNDTRLQQVVAEAEKYETPEKNIENRETFLRLMNGVTYGQSEEQGIVEGNKFYHKELDFRLAFPQGWTVINQPNQIVAQNSATKQAVIVQLKPLNKRESAQQYLQNNFAGFQPIKAVNTSEDQAYMGNAVIGKNQQKAVVGTVYRGNQAFVMVGFGAQSLPSNELVNTMQSLRKLNKSELDNASAKKIKLVRAKSGDTFSRLAKSSKRLGKYAEQELRLLNGMFPTGEPKAGQLLKIIN